MEDDFDPGLIILIILPLAAALLIWAAFFVEPVPPRHFNYYCYNPEIDQYYQCRHGDTTQIDVLSARSPGETS